MQISRSELSKKIVKKTSTKIIIIVVSFVLILLFGFIALCVGSSSMSFTDSLKAVFMNGTNSQIRIIYNIRLPRIIAAIVAGAGLSVSGLIMQTTLNNPMASPSTLGVSNAAVFGANLSIIGFAGGFLTTGNNINSYTVGANPFATSSIAFIFSIVSILAIIGLAQIRNFNVSTIVIAGIAIGSIWTAGTTILQFYAPDVGLSAAVIWNFGDLGRATYVSDGIMAGIIVPIALLFFFLAPRYNALLSGKDVASSVGINVKLLQTLSLLLASLITAVCVSYLGIIGFIGIICPHIMRRILGNDHKFLIPSSILAGSLLLLLADTFSRTIGNGSALPVGAITTLLGAPFFLALIFLRKERQNVRG